MARNRRSVRIEDHENLAAQLSAAQAAQVRQIHKLRTATDHTIYRLARLIRTPEAQGELDKLMSLLLDLWDDVATQGRAQQAAHDYIKNLRRDE